MFIYSCTALKFIQRYCTLLAIPLNEFVHVATVCTIDCYQRVWTTHIHITFQKCQNAHRWYHILRVLAYFEISSHFCGTLNFVRVVFTCNYAT